MAINLISKLRSTVSSVGGGLFNSRPIVRPVPFKVNRGHVSETYPTSRKLSEPAKRVTRY